MDNLLVGTGWRAARSFDHFGDFEHKHVSRERDVRDLAERAWRERMRIHFVDRAQRAAAHPHYYRAGASKALKP
jgi:hypothetical protein